MNKKTPVAVVYTDGEVVEGYIEWYDRNCIKLNRDRRAEPSHLQGQHPLHLQGRRIPGARGRVARREMTVPRIGLAAGDPGGVGPEVVVKTLASPDLLPPAYYIVFADPRVLEAEERRLGLRTGPAPGRPGQAGTRVFLVPSPL